MVTEKGGRAVLEHCNFVWILNRVVQVFQFEHVLEHCNFVWSRYNRRHEKTERFSRSAYVVEIRGFVRSNATEKRLLPRANRVSLGVRKGKAFWGVARPLTT